MLVILNFTMSTGLDQLAMGSVLTYRLKLIQESMRTFHEDVNRHMDSGSAPPSWEQTTTTSWNNDQDHPKRIPGTSWAKEMDIFNPILDKQAGDEAQVEKVLPHTKAFITETFHSMANNARRSFQSKFIIPKAPITRTPHLDEVYTDSCSKGTNKRTGPWHMYWH